MVLPSEMIEEILVRIPAGYVWDIRRVCKSWDALIVNPQFATKHLERNTQESSSILLIAFCQRLIRKSLSLFRLNHHPHTLALIDAEASHELNFFENPNFPDCFKELVVAGSFNGIVCVSSFCKSISRFLALWNPAINHWKPIPLLPPGKKDDEYFSVGLAFDSLTNDYRIIRLVSVVTDDYPQPSSRIEIYSVNQHSWLFASSAPIPFFTTQPNCSVIVNGVPYWSRNYLEYVDHANNRFQTNVIATVDPHTGLYTQISYPQIATNENTTVHPFNFMDSLAVLIYSPGQPKMFHVYTLDRGVDWIHLHTSAPTILQNTNMCILRCFQDAGGKIIVVGWNFDDRKRSFLYDLQTDCLCHSIGMDAFRPRWDETYYHVETLVCLDGMEPIKRVDSNNNEHGGLSVVMLQQSNQPPNFRFILMHLPIFSE
ncbi:F-box domain-containing protein [Heracleum sosnowskyi]|uniref:F-box domain-containing protein n=1 Tax=Heracleum sosnowskyi TaxID=360622 RepID=A0AAD8HCP3_9APIA|nr:F-box domain-containing protein [Heracleum sosnowskyi]